jgi:hypothetical protein
MIDNLQDAPPELCYTSSFVCYKQVTPSGGSQSMDLQISFQTLCPLVSNPMPPRCKPYAPSLQTLCSLVSNDGEREYLKPEDLTGFQNLSGLFNFKYFSSL